MTLGRRDRAPRPAPPLPPHAAGMRIGLLGGSFDPAHAAHRMISLAALRRLGLDAVWWLVTPGNPLKSTAALAPAARRAEAARRVAGHPRIRVTTVEEGMGTRFTRDTLALLMRRCPGVRFVWLMGSDNLAGFHRWKRWGDIFGLMPVAVFDRPGSTLKAAASRAGTHFGRFRRPERVGRGLVGTPAPAWAFFHGPRSSLSSTAIRAKTPRFH